MPLNCPQSGYFLALYTLIQLVLNVGCADFSRNKKNARPKDPVYTLPEHPVRRQAWIEACKFAKDYPY